MLLDAADSQLVLVDYQERLMAAITVAKMFFSAVEEGLLDCLRPPSRGGSGNARSLPKHLQKPVAPAQTRGTVVLAGCEAHVCLLQTALELTEQEMDVWVVTDACSSRTERSRDAAFDRLAGNGAANLLEGGLGNDGLNGRGGADLPSEQQPAAQRQDEAAR